MQQAPLGRRVLPRMTHACMRACMRAGGYVCGEGFLNGQLTVTRGLGDFGPSAAPALQQPRGRERLKYRSSLDDGEPLQLMGPLTSGAGAWGRWTCRLSLDSIGTLAWHLSPGLRCSRSLCACMHGALQRETIIVSGSFQRSRRLQTL